MKYLFLFFIILALGSCTEKQSLPSPQEYMKSMRDKYPDLYQAHLRQDCHGKQELCPVHHYIDRDGHKFTLGGPDK